MISALSKGRAIVFMIRSASFAIGAPLVRAVVHRLALETRLRPSGVPRRLRQPRPRTQDRHVARRTPDFVRAWTLPSILSPPHASRARAPSDAHQRRRRTVLPGRSLPDRRESSGRQTWTSGGACRASACRATRAGTRTTTETPGCVRDACGRAPAAPHLAVLRGQGL